MGNSEGRHKKDVDAVQSALAQLRKEIESGGSSSDLLGSLESLEQRLKRVEIRFTDVSGKLRQGKAQPSKSSPRALKPSPSDSNPKIHASPDASPPAGGGTKFNQQPPPNPPTNSIQLSRSVAEDASSMSSMHSILSDRQSKPDMKSPEPPSPSPATVDSIRDLLTKSPQSSKRPSPPHRSAPPPPLKRSITSTSPADIAEDDTPHVDRGISEPLRVASPVAAPVATVPSMVVAPVPVIATTTVVTLAPAASAPAAAPPVAADAVQLSVAPVLGVRAPSPSQLSAAQAHPPMAPSAPSGLSIPVAAPRSVSPIVPVAGARPAARPTAPVTAPTAVPMTALTASVVAPRPASPREALLASTTGAASVPTLVEPPSRSVSSVPGRSPAPSPAPVLVVPPVTVPRGPSPQIPVPAPRSPVPSPRPIVPSPNPVLHVVVPSRDPSPRPPSIPTPIPIPAPVPSPAPDPASVLTASASSVALSHSGAPAISPIRPASCTSLDDLPVLDVDTDLDDLDVSQALVPAPAPIAIVAHPPIVALAPSPVTAPVTAPEPTKLPAALVEYVSSAAVSLRASPMELGEPPAVPDDVSVDAAPAEEEHKEDGAGAGLLEVPLRGDANRLSAVSWRDSLMLDLPAAEPVRRVGHGGDE
jgi:hypothetical protein